MGVVRVVGYVEYLYTIGCAGNPDSDMYNKEQCRSLIEENGNVALAK